MIRSHDMHVGVLTMLYFVSTLIVEYLLHVCLCPQLSSPVLQMCKNRHGMALRMEHGMRTHAKSWVSILFMQAVASHFNYRVTTWDDVSSFEFSPFCEATCNVHVHLTCM